MKLKSTMTLFAAGVVALLAFGHPAVARASDSARRGATRVAWNGIRSDRGQLHAAHGDLNRDH